MLLVYQIVESIDKKINVQIAHTKRVNFDGDDDNDRCIRPIMFEHKRHVEAQVVDPLKQPAQVEPSKHVKKVEDVEHVDQVQVLQQVEPVDHVQSED